MEIKPEEYKRMYEAQLHRNDALMKRHKEYEQEIEGRIKILEKSVSDVARDGSWKKHNEEWELIHELLSVIRRLLNIEGKKYGMYNKAHPANERITIDVELARAALEVMDYYGWDDQ